MNFFRSLRVKLRDYFKKLKDKLTITKVKPGPESAVKPDEMKVEAVVKKIKVPKREKEELKISKKPYIKKTPPELGKKEKSEKKKKEIVQKKEEIIVDLGKKPSKSRKSKKVKKPERLKVESEIRKVSAEIRRPFVELNFSELAINLIIPKQVINLTSPISSVVYRVKINEESFNEIANIKQLNNTYYEVERREIEMHEPLLSFQVKYPIIFNNTKYSFNYYHKDTALYIFSRRYKDRAKMIELWDQEGKINLIPKKKLWVLHHDLYELEVEYNLSEDLWIWNYSMPKFVDLREKSFICLKNRENGQPKKFACNISFYLEGDQTPSDDFGEEFPLFTGGAISLISPRINPDGWVIWLQNKEIGSHKLNDNWSGENPFDLKCPEDLGILEGTFQLDITDKGTRIPIETIYFRYSLHIECEYPRELVIPTHDGHKNELICIGLEESIENWNILLNSDVLIKEVNGNNQYQIIVPKNQDTVNFSLKKKNSDFKKLMFEITIPRLKWKIGNQKEWTGKILEKNRNILITGIDLFLEVTTNDYNNSYKIMLQLFSAENNQLLQETTLIMETINHMCNLNRFFDTILTNSNHLFLSLEVINRTTNYKYPVVNILEFPDRDTIRRLYKFLLEFQRERMEEFILSYKNYCSKNNENKKFSVDELFEVLTLSFNQSNSLEDTGIIYKLLSKINYTVKKGFQNSLRGLFKNIILNKGNSGIEIKDRIEYLEFRIDFENYFDLSPPDTQDIFKLILKKNINVINDNYLFYNRLCNIFKPDISNFEDFRVNLLEKHLFNGLKRLNEANDNFENKMYSKCCESSYKAVFKTLKALLFFEHKYPDDKNYLSITQMYSIAFKENFSKYLDNFKKLHEKNYNLNQKHAWRAYKSAEEIFSKIKRGYDFFYSHLKNPLKQKTILNKFEWRFPKNDIPDVIRDYLQKHKTQYHSNYCSIPPGFLKFGIRELNIRYDKEEIIVYGLQIKKNK